MVLVLSLSIYLITYDTYVAVFCIVATEYIIVLKHPNLCLKFDSSHLPVLFGKYTTQNILLVSVTGSDIFIWTAVGVEWADQ